MLDLQDSGVGVGDVRKLHEELFRRDSCRDDAERREIAGVRRALAPDNAPFTGLRPVLSGRRRGYPRRPPTPPGIRSFVPRRFLLAFTTSFVA